MTSEELRRRLLVTIATSLGLYACAEKTPPSPQNVPVSSVDASAAPKVHACLPGTKQERYCLKSGTRPPQIMRAPAPPPPLDANGCVAAEIVRDGCNAIDDVLAGPQVGGGQCCYQVCRMPVAAPCGRPLVIDGASRIAPVLRTGPGRGDDGPTLRVALRDAWLADAQMEHASVASFARFTLELLAVGAPVELVAEAQRAGLDEVAHAKACFELAQRCDPGAATFGAAALDLSGLVIRTSLAEVAAAVVEEACCGETLAALALLRASAACAEPHVKAVLERIAEDEARHAELGYRFVAWAIATGGTEIRDVVRSAFSRGVSRLREEASGAAAEPEHDAHAWVRAGRLTAGDLAATRREACDGVIEPAARLLLRG